MKKAEDQVSELEKSANCANMRGAEAGLPDLLSHHHTLRTRVRLAMVRHAAKCRDCQGSLEYRSSSLHLLQLVKILQPGHLAARLK